MYRVVQTNENLVSGVIDNMVVFTTANKENVKEFMDGVKRNVSNQEAFDVHYLQDDDQAFEYEFRKNFIDFEVGFRVKYTYEVA